LESKAASGYRFGETTEGSDQGRKRRRTRHDKAEEGNGVQLAQRPSLAVHGIGGRRRLLERYCGELSLGGPRHDRVRVDGLFYAAVEKPGGGGADP